LQRDEVGGLLVQSEDGDWIDAVPVPGAFVFNVGEMLEIATQGCLKATQHRVVGPQSGVHRYPIPAYIAGTLAQVKDNGQLLTSFSGRL
jgi:isopenicillin N synthase-like dioxygenase